MLAGITWITGQRWRVVQSQIGLAQADGIERRVTELERRERRLQLALVAQHVLDVIKVKYWSFIPRSGSGRREERVIKRDLVPAAISKGREGTELSEDELTALFAENRPEAIEDMRQAADELFYEEGIHTVGIDRVIERAGVAKASLYKNFGSKDELVREYLAQCQSQRDCPRWP